MTIRQIRFGKFHKVSSLCSFYILQLYKSSYKNLKTLSMDIPEHYYQLYEHFQIDLSLFLFSWILGNRILWFNELVIIQANISPKLI